MMKENFNLLMDLQSALKSTLKMNINLENLRTKAFNKKFSLNSANTIRKITNDLENLQGTLEKYNLVKKYIKPKLSPPRLSRSSTPTPYQIVLPSKSNNCLKQIVRISNSRLCCSRAGHIEVQNKNMMETITNSFNISENFEEKEQERSSSALRKIFEKIDKQKEVGRGISVEKVPESKSQSNFGRKHLKGIDEKLVKKLVNPELAIKMCSMEFKKVESDKNIAMMKKIRLKLLK